MASKPEDHLVVSRDGNVLTLTLNNPAKANSMSQPMVSLLKSTLASAATDPSVSAVVLTGNGKFFCTGMDLSASSATVGTSRSATASSSLESTFSLFDSVDSFPKPTIALINGPCYGGGNGLAFVCDIRVAVKGAKFGLTEVKRGLVPATISRYIVREWGTAVSREAMITGRPVGAEELFRVGAIYRLADDLEGAKKITKEILANLASSAPRAVGMTKELVKSVYEDSAAERDRKIGEAYVDMLGPSEEAAYGIAQFQAGNRGVDWAKWAIEKSKL